VHKYTDHALYQTQRVEKTAICEDTHAEEIEGPAKVSINLHDLMCIDLCMQCNLFTDSVHSKEKETQNDGWQANETCMCLV